MLRLFWLAARSLKNAIFRFPHELALAIGPGQATGRSQQVRLLIAASISLPIALVVAVLLQGIMLVMSPSIDAWALRPSPGKIRRGDLVSFTLSHPIAGPRPVSVTKRALCLPGEMLRSVERPSRTPGAMFDGWYYCGPRFLAISRPATHDGRSLAHLQWGERAVPAGFVYLGSDHPDGFDSRYFGLVPIARLTRMEKIL
ncbi:S26 family signal peptidase [Sphingobium yanoikuyae]|uniref:S26 family signal peptidase n=1 Tax=Sphingobium yanoikuyae TaxID=13690 RepID=UPI0035B4CAED